MPTTTTTTTTTLLSFIHQDESAASIVQAYAEEHVLGSDAAAEPADPDLGDYRT